MVRWMLVGFLKIVITAFVRVKWHLLQPYFNGLAVQARYIYLQSDLCKLRIEEMGLNYAEWAFERNPKEQEFFFDKARREPFWIKWQIFWDATRNRTATPYYLSEEYYEQRAGN